MDARVYGPLSYVFILYARFLCIAIPYSPPIAVPLSQLYYVSMPTRVAPQSNIWKITLIITLVVATIFLLPQLSVLILACLMAFIFYPLYQRLKRGNAWSAAVATLVISLLAVIIPLVTVLLLTAAQLFQLAETLGSAETTRNITGLLSSTDTFFRTVIEPLTGIRIDLSAQGIGNFLRTSLPDVLRAFGGFALGLVSGIPQLVIATIVYVFVFVELLVRGHKLIALLYDISPFERSVTARYIERVGLMANAMVKGQLVISMIISAIASALMIPLGYGEYVFILFILFTILNFIPLGCGVVVFPLAIYSALTVSFWPAAIVLIIYSIAANIDSVLRPIFIPKKIQLSTAVTMVATFCGIAYFGILGVVYGPIIMILIITALTLYREQKSAQAL